MEKERGEREDRGRERGREGDRRNTLRWDSPCLRGLVIRY